MRLLPFFILPLLLTSPARGQGPGVPAVGPEPRPAAWTARWIAFPGAPARTYGVYHFRRAFELADRPRRFRVHVSGDNRYELYVNGRRVLRGPARGDVASWSYETLDLAPHLQRGRNVLAAVVWNFAEHAPHAQISHRTGFLLQGDGEVERKLVDTGPAWRAARNPAYEVIPFNPSNMKSFFVTGPGDRVRGAEYPWGWETPGFDDAAWAAAITVGPAQPRDGNAADNEWMLVPRAIPLMEETPERLRRVRRAQGVTPPAAFPARPAPFRVPARTRAELLLDQNHLTTAYPELVVSGGRGGRVRLAYAENLWGPGEGDKGHRDEVEGKSFRGNFDEFLPDGGPRRLFSPLWWRTYRFMQVTIETGDEPLTIEDLRGIYTGYPFQRRARFGAGVPEIDRILDVGWRTARLCAHETYVDCPYYEQLQYTGDTRVQALVSLYMSGDDRLMRNAIRQFNESRVRDELPMSRYPVRVGQYIPTFALVWIGMLHDFWWYRDDPAFVREMLPGVRAVLAYFERRQREDGGVGALPYWNFVDWVPSWPAGVPPGWNVPPSFARLTGPRPAPGDPAGATAPLDLHLLLAYRWAADLERAHGDPALAERHEGRAARLRGAFEGLYWDGPRGLFADTPARKDFSQHTNVLAVLAGIVEGGRAAELVRRILDEPGLAQASIYFRYYLHEALRKVGLGDLYLEQLGPWRRMLALGLTTWAETEDPSRSECHAWGSSPNIELFRTVLGVDAAAPGFRRVRIQPALGKLTRASGVIPHPAGDLSVSLELRGDRLHAEVQLPRGVEGEILWRGERRPLAPGRARLVLAGARP